MHGSLFPDATTAPRNWIAVASAEHARQGRDADAGFMQVCHGKLAPIRRVRPGDRIAYYAPTLRLGERVPCQSFVSLGRVRVGDPYAFDMGGGFVPWRRDVDYLPAREAPIRPLLDALAFTRGGPHWGWRMRFGLFAVDDADLRCIARAMDVDPAALGL